MLPTIASDLEVSGEQMSKVFMKCDPDLARTGEAFLDPEMEQFFDREMLQLLRDARTTWM